MGSSKQPRCVGVRLHGTVQHAVVEQVVKEGVGQPPRTVGFCGLPPLEHVAFDAPEGFFLWNAYVSDTVQALSEKGCFVGRGKIAPVWNRFVVVQGDQAEHVLLEVGARA